MAPDQTTTNPPESQQTTPTPLPKTTPTQPVQTTTIQPTETTGGKLFDKRYTIEQYITPKEVHWVDISEISSFSVQNIIGTILMNVGTLMIGMTSQVKTNEEGGVQLQWIMKISGLILFTVGIFFFGASYLVTLRQIKQKKKRLEDIIEYRK